MNRIFLSLLLCMPVLLAACTKAAIDEEYPRSSQPVVMTFNFGVDALAAPVKDTRSDGSVDEDIAEDTRIHDLNIYMWDESDASTMVHRYQTSGSSLTITLVPGRYQTRVVANVGHDMGTMTPELLDKTCSGDLISAELQRRTLLFAAKQQVDISGATTAFNVVLKRLFARAYINVEVHSAFTSILSVISAEVCNIPTTAALFNAPQGAENYPAAELCTGISKMKRATDGKLSDVIYIYENLKPSNPLITSQDKRSKENAPAGATYIHILTQSIVGFHHYYIYLGENTTSDFTIRRNTSVKYDVTIMGVNANDYRVLFTQFVLKDGSTKCDLETWPTSKSAAVFNYGTYLLYDGSTEFQEGRYWAKTFTDQYSLDKGATWHDSDTTTFIPLTKQNDYGITVRDFATSIPHPGEVYTSFVESYYKDGDFCQLNNNALKKTTRRYGYTINFKIEGMDAFSDFVLGELSGKDDKNNDVLYFLNRDYSTTGTFSIFAYPNQRTADTPHLDMSFSWPATYKFLGFFNKNGVKFNATTDPIADTHTSWSTNGIGTTTVFWREANQGSGDIYLRFEKKPVALSIQMKQSINSTCKLNRNRITLVQSGRTAPVKVQFTCTEGQGIFLRNAKLNSATGLYEGTPVVTYNQTCTFTGGKAQVPEVVFVPFVSGVVKYTVSVTDSATGSLLNEVVAANTIAKSTMDVSFGYAIPRETIDDKYLEYSLPGPSNTNYMLTSTQLGYYHLYAYAFVQKGGGLEYWPTSELDLFFDTTITYIYVPQGFAPDQVLVRNPNPALITTIQRTCQLNIYRDLTFTESDTYYPYAPVSAILRDELDQYATRVFPKPGVDSDQVKDIGTPQVNAEDIWYDGSFVPNVGRWVCVNNSTKGVINVGTSVPTNIRITGAEVNVNLPAIYAPMWMPRWDDMPK